MAIINITSGIIERLKHVNTVGLKPGIYQFPDFFIVGPQRTATTWLHKYLIQHPDVFMPHRKELYFFNYLKIKDKEGLNNNSDRLEWYSNQFSISVKKFIQKNWVLAKTFKTFKKLDYNISNFFSPKIIGEATASYAVMDKSLIKEIHTLNPKAKILISIRNPIERAWSHASKDLITSKRPLHSIPFHEFEKFYQDEYMLSCGKYVEIVTNWRSIFPSDQIFLVLFKYVEQDPKNLLKATLTFLGLSPEKLINRLDERDIQRINQTSRHKVPKVHAEFLQELFKVDMRNAEDFLDNPF